MDVQGHIPRAWTTAVCLVTLALIAFSGETSGNRIANAITPSPTATPHKRLCEPFPDRLIDEFIAAYNERDLEALESLVSVSSIEDAAAGAYVGDARFAGVADWAQAGWDEDERMNLTGYLVHPKKPTLGMSVVRRSSKLAARGIESIVTTFDAVRSGCSLVSLELSGPVQSKHRPCAFYEEFAEIDDVQASEPQPCRDGSGDYARTHNVLAWTGDRALIWGGDRGGPFTYPDTVRGGLSFDPISKRWTPFPSPKLPDLHAQAGFWTGQEMIVFGSRVRGKPSTWVGAFDPISKTWRAIDFPWKSWSGYEGVWTGHELILWGGANNFERPRRRGAIYNPATDTWRETSPAPGSGRGEHGAIWTGSEMVVWGGSNNKTDLVTGLAYNPVTDAWRKTAPAPLSARVWLPLVWTGQEMIAWGGSSYSRNRADGAAYDPALDSWRKLPPAPLSARHYHSMTWTGSEVIVFGGYDYHRSFRDGAAYNPATNSWRRIPRAPISQRCCHTATWTGETMIVYGGSRDLGDMALGDGGLYNPTTDRWRRVVPSLRPECGVVELTGDDYETEITPSSGPPGTVVRVSGPTVRGEDGRWAPADRLEMWWNTEFPDRKRPIDPGLVVKLVEVEDMERCRFTAAFRVPDVAPGAFVISKHTWENRPSRGYGTDPYHLFIVTP